jgi:hypothetical protein
MRASQIRLLSLALAVAAFGCCPAVAPLLGPAWARERPTTVPAARFLQDTIDRAFALVRPPVSNQAASDLAEMIEGAMDWPALTRFAIGHYAADLDADGMRSVTRRLEERLAILARRAGTELPGMTVTVRDLRIDPDGSRRILSTATVPRFGEVEVEWTLAPAPSGYRIADIKALGLTLRQFLRSWVAGLVAARGGDAAATFGEGADTSPQ